MLSYLNILTKSKYRAEIYGNFLENKNEVKVTDEFLNLSTLASGVLSQVTASPPGLLLA